MLVTRLSHEDAMNARRGQYKITRSLAQDKIEEHGMTIEEYEAEMFKGVPQELYDPRDVLEWLGY